MTTNTTAAKLTEAMIEVASGVETNLVARVAPKLKGIAIPEAVMLATFKALDSSGIKPAPLAVLKNCIRHSKSLATIQKRATDHYAQETDGRWKGNVYQFETAALSRMTKDGMSVGAACNAVAAEKVAVAADEIAEADLKRGLKTARDAAKRLGRASLTGAIQKIAAKEKIVLA